ncbi:restriction endonuclease [Campylobacter troglodytis]|uniref:restriction endonuclease n=1 Tax=Campylobacter troglodytis TaxID=654363 RepID=UPI00115B43FA|nr:restriction endonuclease [Campylobacter troglodytis]TQR60272.1 restriction endonuclease [Campylobacter troglodytis]
MYKIERNKWILYRHTSSFEYLLSVAECLKSFSKTNISKDEKAKLNLHLKELGLYNERNPNFVLDAINHKINQLCYYMFGYKAKFEGSHRFMFSPLGNLLLKFKDDKDKRAKIFLTMLWGIQFAHPHGGTHKEFELYPFRLIFKLLSDKRLEFKLFAFEVAYLLVFIRDIDENVYENLVQNILNLRTKSDIELAKLFTQDRHTYVNSAYEWDYYVSKFLQSAGVLECKSGKIICKLQHGNTNTFRKITRNFVLMPECLKDFANLLERDNSFLQKPLKLDDKERLKIDIVKEIYSFYPSILLEILEQSDEAQQYLKLPKLIEEYANNPQNQTADLFETVLTQGFNMFYNVEAKKLSGAGRTDIECLYLTKKKKFAVEAKSTTNKLLGINTARLKEHRDEIGGAYTIIITPRYVPAAKRDIIASQNVLLLATTFAEYLYNCMSNDIRQIDYKEFDEIITQNLGKDISGDISNLSLAKFGLTQ